MTENNVTLDMERIPQHIAIIMDGNGRWATERGKDRQFGHQAGVEAIKKVTTECANLGVKFLTLYTFSTENWNRPPEEVAALMGLVLTALQEEIFMKNNVRFRVIGDRSRMPAEVQKKLRDAEEHTANNDKMTLVVALSYSSKWEITEAVRNIAADVKEGKMKLSEINEKCIEKHLQTHFMGDPELLIRTGGELRVSNYLLWQIAYTEFYFCDTYWPDYDEACLHEAIANYQSRHRRFGKTEAQVEREMLEGVVDDSEQ